MENLHNGLIDRVISNMEKDSNDGVYTDAYYAIGYLGASVADDPCLTVPLCDVVKLLQFLQENRIRRW